MIDQDKLANAIREKFEITKPWSPMHYADLAVEAVVEFLGERHEPKPNTGPAFIAKMPPSPESNRRYWSMYCRECGIEEMMADSAGDPRLIARRDNHNANIHAPVVPQPSESDVPYDAKGVIVATINQVDAEHDLGSGDLSSSEEYADAILAAFPILSRDIAGEIEAEDTQVRVDNPRVGASERWWFGYLDGLRRAAEIARSGR